MATGIPSIPPSAAEGNCGAVSLLRMLELYGQNHRAELDELWNSPGTEYLVLFADNRGENLAILTVGPQSDYKQLDEAVALEIDGLHAICHTPALGAYRTGRSAASWQLDEDERSVLAATCPESADSLAQAIADARQRGVHPVRAAMSHIVQRTREIVHREHYVSESENKLSERAQKIVEHIAELEQREAELMNRVASFELKVKGSRHPFDRDLSGLIVPASRR